MTSQKQYFCLQIYLRCHPLKVVTNRWLITDTITHVSNTLLLIHSQEDVMRRKRDFTNGNNRKERLRKVREAFPEKNFLLGIAQCPNSF